MSVSQVEPDHLQQKQRATDIHRRLVAADPQSSDMKQELASDHNREGTLQAKLGIREPALANHTRAVEISRELAEANPSDYELRFALAQAQAERADAYVQLARDRRSPSRAENLAAAERDLTSALDIYKKLQVAGTFAASDIEYVNAARAQLEKVRSERAAPR